MILVATAGLAIAAYVLTKSREGRLQSSASLPGAGRRAHQADGLFPSRRQLEKHLGMRHYRLIKNQPLGASLVDWPVLWRYEYRLDYSDESTYIALWCPFDDEQKVVAITTQVPAGLFKQTPGQIYAFHGSQIVRDHVDSAIEMLVEITGIDLPERLKVCHKDVMGGAGSPRRRFARNGYRCQIWWCPEKYLPRPPWICLTIIMVDNDDLKFE